ncbi:uncharacterized protein LOC134684551 [Mytilus trossulus]|uniref:uncharacterized protein LOC134684551 n=1 Tax=Mytilus trossulus TaxID=6551 RepID=UPI003007E55E
MANYIVALSLILIVLMQRKVYCEECSSLKGCLKDNGNDLSNYEFKFDTLAEIKNVWEVICRDTESLTKCYSKNKPVCYEINNPIGFVMSLTFFKATFQHMCEKTNGMAHFSMCMINTLSDQFGNILSTCFGNGLNINDDDFIISKCGTVEQTSTSKCIKGFITGKCSSEAVNFINSPPGSETCSAINMIGQITTVIGVFVLKIIIT